MADLTDVYADGFGLSTGPYGLALTFTLTQPNMVPGPQELPIEPVVRVRMSRQLAETLIEHLTNALQAGGQPQTISTVKH